LVLRVVLIGGHFVIIAAGFRNALLTTRLRY
jgi:hypothetical protein